MKFLVVYIFIIKRVYLLFIPQFPLMPKRLLIGIVGVFCLLTRELTVVGIWFAGLKGSG